MHITTPLHTIHTYSYVHTYSTYIHVYTHLVKTILHKYIHTHMYPYSEYIHIYTHPVKTILHKYIHTHMYTYSEYIHMYTYLVKTILGKPLRVSNAEATSSLTEPLVKYFLVVAFKYTVKLQQELLQKINELGFSVLFVCICTY